MSTGLPNRDLIPRYFAPYLAYVGVASLASALPREWDYALRIAATVMALAWGWRHFAPLRGPNALGASVAIGITTGLIGLALWVALLAPFVESNREAWNPAAIALRVVAACCLVPVFEELAMRGFVHRFVIQWQRNRAAGHAAAFARPLARAGGAAEQHFCRVGLGCRIERRCAQEAAHNSIGASTTTGSGDRDLRSDTAHAPTALIALDLRRSWRSSEPQLLGASMSALNAGLLLSDEATRLQRGTAGDPNGGRLGLHVGDAGWGAARAARLNVPEYGCI